MIELLKIPLQVICEDIVCTSDYPVLQVPVAKGTLTLNKTEKERKGKKIKTRLDLVQTIWRDVHGKICG